MKRNLVLVVTLLAFMAFSGDIYAQKSKKKSAKTQKTEQKSNIKKKKSKSPGVEKDIVTKIVNNMVLVKGGSFQMGATAEQGKDIYEDERPKHSVKLSDFHIGKFELTQAEWQAVMGDNPSYFKGNNLPVENVSWNDVQRFIKKLNQMSGKKFRLPTEAEWEYAARGGAKTKNYKYCGANSYNSIAWHKDNAAKKTHAVGQKKGNELGLCDMSGNVYEWCADSYGSYSSKSQTNPKMVRSDNFKVTRGGSFLSMNKFLRTSFRSKETATTANPNLGFRLVMER